MQLKKEWIRYQPNDTWDVPYLTIDPEDIGKKYQAIIRINSQSGKGGVAYILEHDFQCCSKNMQPTVAKFIQKSTESSGSEISSQQIWGIFEDEFINRNTPLELEKVHTELFEDGQVKSDLLIKYNGSSHSLTAVGNGPIDASKKALESIIANMSIESYSEHSLSQGSDSKAICYLTVLYEDETFHGVGIDSNITLASIKALISSINRKLNS